MIHSSDFRLGEFMFWLVLFLVPLGVGIFAPVVAFTLAVICLFLTVLMFTQGGGLGEGLGGLLCGLTFIAFGVGGGLGYLIQYFLP